MKLHLAFALVLALASSASAEVYSYDALGRPTRITYGNGTEYSLRYGVTGDLTRKFFGDAAGGGGGGGGGCFIATAAWGTALDPHVVELRAFRDEWLSSNAPGRVLIAAYERLSPPLAAWIAEREAARTATRWALTPLVLSVTHPRASLALLVLAAAAWWGRRRMLRAR